MIYTATKPFRGEYKEMNGKTGYIHIEFRHQAFIHTKIDHINDWHNLTGSSQVDVQ